MDEAGIRAYVAQTFAGVNVMTPDDGAGAGDTFFIYDPNGDLPPNKQLPFATIVQKNYGDFDALSELDRPGVFRLNVGLSRETFKHLFPEDETHEYAALDVLMPHPVYATQSWVSVLNPSDATFERVKPLLREAYDRATTRTAGSRD